MSGTSFNPRAMRGELVFSGRGLHFYSSTPVRCGASIASYTFHTTVHLQPPRNSGRTTAADFQSVVSNFNPRASRGKRQDVRAQAEHLPSTQRDAGRTPAHRKTRADLYFNPRATLGALRAAAAVRELTPSTPARCGANAWLDPECAHTSLQPPRNAGRTGLSSQNNPTRTFSPRATRGTR